MTYLYVFIGGGLGSLARFLTSRYVTKAVATDFPLGTLISNIVACLLLGLLVVWSTKSASASWVQPMLVIGFCGGYSTFSTFSNETVSLIENNQIGLAILNVVISVLFGLSVIFYLKAKA